MRKFSRPTLKDVAELSGVSEISVSRVMRGAPNISDRLREKVQAAAKELNYTPNRLAGALASKSTDLLAVIVPSMSNSVFPEVLDGIDSALNGTCFRTVLGISHYDEKREEEIIRDLLAWNPSGIIVSGFEHTEASRQLLASFPNPVIEIMDADGEPIDTSIGVSQDQAGALMAQHLVNQGYRNIAYIGAWGERPSRSHKRRLAFENNLKRLGVPLKAKLIKSEDSSMLLGKEACRHILNECPDIDAIFFANDDLVTGAFIHCMQNGISIPDQVALAGFNGLPLVDAMPIKITTIKTPRYEMGVEAAKLFLNRMAEQEPSTNRRNKITMDLELVVGQTT